MNSITSLEDIEPGDLLMLHSTVAATPEHPEGRRQNIRIDGLVQNVEVHNVSMHVPTLTGEMQVMKITQLCIGVHDENSRSRVETCTTRQKLDN